jgi:hypothetical protein
MMRRAVSVFIVSMALASGFCCAGNDDGIIGIDVPVDSGIVGPDVPLQ